MIWIPCPNCDNMMWPTKKCAVCGHIDNSLSCNCSHCKWLHQVYGKSESNSSESLLASDTKTRKEKSMSNCFGTMGSIRGNETIVIDESDETVCVCSGEDHADMADRIARLLEQDSDSDWVTRPMPAVTAVVMAFALIGLLLMALILGTFATIANP